MKSKKISFDLIMKIFAVIIFCGILIIVIYNFLPEKKLTDCSKPIDVILLKPSETKYASQILNGGVNRVVYYPEINKIHAKTELLECDNFDYRDYINLDLG